VAEGSRVYLELSLLAGGKKGISQGSGCVRTMQISEPAAWARET
jgi:hypothetical protein